MVWCRLGCCTSVVWDVGLGVLSGVLVCHMHWGLQRRILCGVEGVWFVL